MALVPDWLKGVITTMQERSDAKYEDELKVWKQAAADWTTAGVVARDSGNMETPFTKPIPGRVVFGVDDAGNLTQATVTDESIQIPELPPAKPKVQASAFTTGAPAQSEAIIETLQLVRQIAAYFPAPAV